MVFDTVHYAQRRTVEPTLAHDAVHIRRCSCCKCCHSRRTVYVLERIISIRVHLTATKQTLEAIFPVKSAELIEKIGTQLVYSYVYIEFRRFHVLLGKRRKKTQQHQYHTIFNSHILSLYMWNNERTSIATAQK